MLRRVCYLPHAVLEVRRGRAERGREELRWGGVVWGQGRAGRLGAHTAMLGFNY